MTAATFRSRVGLVSHGGIDHACVMLHLGSTLCVHTYVRTCMYIR